MDVQGDYENSEKVPTTISGTAIFTINEAVGKDKKGQQLISQEFQASAEFTEGVLTFDFHDFDKVAEALKNANATVSAISLTLDSKDLPNNVKQLLINALTNSSRGGSYTPQKPASDHDDNKAAKRADQAQNAHIVNN